MSEPRVTTLSLTDQYITLFCVCFYLNFELTDSSTLISCLNKGCLTWIFSLRHLTPFLCLGALDSTLALCLQPFSTVRATKANEKKKKRHEVCYHMDTYLQCEQYESWDKKVEPRLVWLQLGRHASGDWLFLQFCVCLWMTTKMPWVLILGLQIRFGKQANLQVRMCT